MTMPSAPLSPNAPHANAARQRWCKAPVQLNAAGLQVGGQQVIQYWERPVMEAMGRFAAHSGGHVLEVGFGLGLSAAAIAAQGCERYTVIEAHPQIAANARTWTDTLSMPANVIEGFWQDLINDLPTGRYDGILFDTCPIEEAERDIWYRAFIPHAARLLRPGGVFTYYAHQSAPGPLRDQWLLARYFPRIEPPEIITVAPSEDCQYWNHSTLLVPKVYR